MATNRQLGGGWSRQARVHREIKDLLFLRLCRLASHEYQDVLFVLVFMMHGSLWLWAKSEGDLAQRAKDVADKLWNAVLVFAVIFLLYSYVATKLWDNYFKHPLLFVIPLIAVIALVMVKVYLVKGENWKGWFASSLTI